MGPHKKWRFGAQIESPAPGSPLLPPAPAGAWFAFAAACAARTAATALAA